MKADSISRLVQASGLRSSEKLKKLMLKIADEDCEGLSLKQVLERAYPISTEEAVASLRFLSSVLEDGNNNIKEVRTSETITPINQKVAERTVTITFSIVEEHGEQ
jgi:hypothetical protein